MLTQFTSVGNGVISKQLATLRYGQPCSQTSASVSMAASVSVLMSRRRRIRRRQTAIVSITDISWMTLPSMTPEKAVGATSRLPVTASLSKELHCGASEPASVQRHAVIASIVCTSGVCQPRIPIAESSPSHAFTEGVRGCGLVLRCWIIHRYSLVVKVTCERKPSTTY